MQANTMDRGSQALKAHLSECAKLEMRQTRRGWLQECLGCEAKTEFKYFIGDQQVFHSLEDASCLCRFCFSPCHNYTMVIKELNTDAEIVTVDRPFTCPPNPCKCCCYQKATFSSNNNKLGTMVETCYFCVPSFKIYDHNESYLYLVHPPTCCGGICINCCAEGNPCGKGCCKQSFRIYKSEVGNQGGDEYEGLILKKPKSAMTEIFTDSNAFEIDFPKNATADQKGILTGAAIFINSLFYETSE